MKVLVTSGDDGDDGVEVVCSGKKGLQDEIKQQWVQMVAYSIIRGYPCNTAIRRKKKGSKIKGKILFIYSGCYVAWNFSNKLTFQIGVGCSQINTPSCRQEKTENY